MKKAFAIMVSVLGLLTANAQTAPKLLPFQGRLTDQNGVAVSNGVRLVQFKIYDAPSGGNVVWAGELHRTTVNGGLVNVLLGTKTPLLSVIFDRQLYLEITVDVSGPNGTNDNAITAADPPMLPRQVILPTLFAQESGNSAKLLGYDWSAILASGATNPQTGKISGAKIADSSITSQQIAPQSIQLDDLGPSVTNEFEGIRLELGPIRSSLTNLELSMAGLKADIASLSNCCAQLHIELQSMLEDLKNPWVLYATNVTALRSLGGDSAFTRAQWQYAIVFEGGFGNVSIILQANAIWIVTDLYTATGGSGGQAWLLYETTGTYYFSSGTGSYLNTTWEYNRWHFPVGLFGPGGQPANIYRRRQ